MSFQSLGLSQPILQALALKDYAHATPIQQQAIPTLLKGRDLLGIAQTGTGKTAAFMLPSIDRLRQSDRRAGPRACRMLVLAPTRELASQIAESARAYSQFSQIRVATVSAALGRQEPPGSRARRRRARRHAGPLIDLIEQRFLTLPRSRSWSSTRPTRCSIWASSMRSSRS